VILVLIVERANTIVIPCRPPKVDGPDCTMIQRGVRRYSSNFPPLAPSIIILTFHPPHVAHVSQTLLNCLAPESTPSVTRTLSLFDPAAPSLHYARNKYQPQASAQVPRRWLLKIGYKLDW
jgi:hypothetical protein